MNGYLLAALVFLLDQASKYWITEIIALKSRGFVDVAPFFRLTWVENYGVSTGLLQATTATGRWLLVGLTAAIAIVVAVWLAREKQRLEILALGLVLGGAVGNIVDRVRFGYVVDFLHFFWGQYNFYVFNVADAAITGGVVLLLARALLVREPKPQE